MDVSRIGMAAVVLAQGVDLFPLVVQASAPMMCDHAGATIARKGHHHQVWECPKCKALSIWNRTPDGRGWIEGEWLPLSHFRGPSHKSNCHHTPPGQD